MQANQIPIFATPVNQKQKQISLLTPRLTKTNRTTTGET